MKCKFNTYCKSAYIYLQAAVLSAANRRAVFAKSRSRDAHVNDIQSSISILESQCDANNPISLQRRGAEFGIATLARHFGCNLVTNLGHLWQAVIAPMHQHIDLAKFGEICMFIDQLMPLT